MNLNIPNRQKLLVILAGSAVALFILDWALLTPLHNTWKTHSAEIVTLRKKVADGRNTIARAGQIQRVWTEMQANALPKDTAQAQQDV